MPGDRWKSYGPTTKENYRCDFCSAPSRRSLVGWRYRTIRHRHGRWTQRICERCATVFALPGPDEWLHRSASAD